MYCIKTHGLNERERHTELLRFQNTRCITKKIIRVRLHEERNLRQRGNLFYFSLQPFSRCLQL